MTTFDAAAALEAFYTDQGRQLRQLGYHIGKWTANVAHAEPCDCNLDEEWVGDACIENSVWCWALLRDEGGFAPSYVIGLSDLHAPPR